MTHREKQDLVRAALANRMAVKQAAKQNRRVDVYPEFVVLWSNLRAMGSTPRSVERSLAKPAKKKHARPRMKLRGGPKN